MGIERPLNAEWPKLCFKLAPYLELGLTTLRLPAEKRVSGLNSIGHDCNDNMASCRSVAFSAFGLKRICNHQVEKSGLSNCSKQPLLVGSRRSACWSGSHRKIRSLARNRIREQFSLLQDRINCFLLFVRRITMLAQSTAHQSHEICPRAFSYRPVDEVIVSDLVRDLSRDVS